MPASTVDNSARDYSFLIIMAVNSRITGIVCSALFRQRNKVMRGLDDEETAQTMIEGLRIYYNFIRPHTALKGKTPAEKAKLSGLKGNKWQAIIKKSASQTSIRSDM